MADVNIVFRTFQVTADGKLYELNRPNLATERAVATHLEKEASKFLARNREALGQAYPDAVRLHLANGTNNWFGWCRPGFLDALNDVSNTACFLWAWFAQSYPVGPGQPHEQAVMTIEAMHGLYLRNKAALDALVGEVLSDPNPLGP